MNVPTGKQRVFAAPCPLAKVAFNRYEIRETESGVYVAEEEAGTLWVWAFPELIERPSTTWLLAMVSSDGAGDLWGIDEAGELLVVETKRSTTKDRLADPFEDFVSPEFLQSRDLFDASRLQAAWESGLKKERDWISSGATCPTPRVVRGVVPHSSHRGTIARWYGFWAACVRPRVLSDEYPEAARRNLDRRRQRNNPPPHFMGLFTVGHESMAGLSRPGRESHSKLVRAVGRDRVSMRGVRCRRDGANASIEQASVELPPAS